MIIRSACRGEGRKTSAPKRAISKREAPMAIISMAQQARPNVMGQMELLRTQFTALSSVVRMRPSGGSSPNVTVRMRLASCSLPTVFSKRSSPFIGLLYSLDRVQAKVARTKTVNGQWSHRLAGLCIFELGLESLNPRIRTQRCHLASLQPHHVYQGRRKCGDVEHAHLLGYCSRGWLYP